MKEVKMKLFPVLICAVLVLLVSPLVSASSVDVRARVLHKVEVKLMATAEFAHQLDYYGRLHVKGKILVHSNSELLNKHIDDQDFQFDSNRYILATYTFTADRVRES